MLYREINTLCYEMHTKFLLGKQTLCNKTSTWHQLTFGWIVKRWQDKLTGRIILKNYLKGEWKRVAVIYLAQDWNKRWTVCERGKEPSGSIKYGVFLD